MLTFEEAVKRWPHLKVTIEQTTRGPEIKVAGSSWSVWVWDNEKGNNLADLDREEHQATIKAEWDKRYPHLYFWVGYGQERPSGAWVKTETGRDGAGIGSFSLDPARLAYLEEQAALAQQDGWFYCTNCDRAYPISEYGYYHFAAVYCKKCCEENPEWLKEAQNESYN